MGGFFGWGLSRFFFGGRCFLAIPWRAKKVGGFLASLMEKLLPL